MSDEKKFVTGLWVEEKQLRYGPITELSFKVEDFIQYLKEKQNAKGYVNVTLAKSKEGKLYAKLNDWQPKAEENKIPEPKHDNTNFSNDETDGLPF